MRVGEREAFAPSCRPITATKQKALRSGAGGAEGFKKGTAEP